MPKLSVRHLQAYVHALAQLPAELRERRRSIHRTKADFARRAGINAGQYREIERGKRFPSLATAATIAEYLHANHRRRSGHLENYLASPETLPAEIVKNIKALGLTPNQFGTLHGFATAQMTYWLRGDCLPSREHARQLLAIFTAAATPLR